MGGDHSSEKAKKDRTKCAPRTLAPIPFETEATERLGVDRSTINRALARIEKAAPEVKEAWKSGDITATQVQLFAAATRRAQSISARRSAASTSSPSTRRAIVTSVVLAVPPSTP